MHTYYIIKNPKKTPTLELNDVFTVLIYKKKMKILQVTTNLAQNKLYN